MSVSKKQCFNREATALFVGSQAGASASISGRYSMSSGFCSVTVGARILKMLVLSEHEYAEAFST